jgi:4-amino-4-deoxy-L-arabinose transferase-like glycosyltransferase
MLGAVSPELVRGAGHQARTERLVPVALALLAAWMLLQAVLHAIAAPAAGLDEAELLVTSQWLALGESSQPPLYSWLQHGVFAATGISILSLAMLKEALLFGAFLAFYGASRIVLGRAGWALAATLALFLIPQIVWESQRTLSHSVLALCLAAVSLLMFLRVLRDGRLGDYALFGLAVGLGLLSKYNFAAFAAALVVAGTIHAPSRSRVLSWRFGVALAIAGVVVLPHALWALDNLPVALVESAKFDFQGQTTLWSRLWEPLYASLVAIAGFGGLPFLVIGSVAFFPSRHGAAGAAEPGRGFIGVLTVVALLLIVALPLATGATTIRDRWLLPVLFILPLALLSLWRARLDTRRLTIIGGIGVLLAVLSSIGLFVTTVQPDLVGKPIQGTEPFRKFAATIEARHGKPAYILSGGNHVGGNMRLNFPDAFVSMGDRLSAPLPRPGLQPAVAVWSGHGPAPAGLNAKLAGLCGMDTVAGYAVERLAELYEGSSKETYELSVVFVPECNVSASSGG